MEGQLFLCVGLGQNFGLIGRLMMMMMMMRRRMMMIRSWAECLQVLVWSREIALQWSFTLSLRDYADKVYANVVLFFAGGFEIFWQIGSCGGGVGRKEDGLLVQNLIKRHSWSTSFHRTK
jgi:hypothetical protein